MIAKVIPKLVGLRLVAPALSVRLFSQEGIQNPNIKDSVKESPIIVPYKKLSGSGQGIWAMLVHYVKHTIKACKLSYADIKYKRENSKKGQISLKEAIEMDIIQSNIYKLIPFSFFIIVPFSEVLIPFYLVLYQNGIPTRFLTQSFVHKKNSNVLAQMLFFRSKLTKDLIAELGRLKITSKAEVDAMNIVIDWLANGFEYNKHSGSLCEVKPVFEKYIWPLIANNASLYREFMFASGVTPLTGVHYFNSLLGLANLGPITLACPGMRIFNKLYFNARFGSLMKKLDRQNQLFDSNSIKALDDNQVIAESMKRGIVPLMETRGEVVKQLEQWIQLRTVRNSIELICFAFLCMKPKPSLQN